MKIAYFTDGLHVKGGIERVLHNKMNYFSKNKDYEFYIVTSDQNFREKFLEYPLNVKIIDLEINYFEDYNKNLLSRIISTKKKYKKHKKLIENFLKKENIDIAISLGKQEGNLLYKLKDKSKKIREMHCAKDYPLIRAKMENRKWYWYLKAYFDIKYTEYISKKYDKLVVLTREDSERWSNKNIEVIHNSTSFNSKKISDLRNKKGISVGRLAPEKGFDLLIQAWEKVVLKFPDWILEIYGEGGEDYKKYLEKLIKVKKLTNNIKLMGASNEINQKYLESSIYIMSSRTEGFGMVLVEAMSFGLPLVSFACPCGPKDIIENGYNGYLAKNGDINDLANKIIKAIEDKERLKKMGLNSKERAEKFSEKTIMKQWEELFRKLI